VTQSENATLTALLVLMVEQQTAFESQLKHEGIDPLRKHSAYCFLVEELMQNLDNSGTLVKTLKTAEEVAKKEVTEVLLKRNILSHQLEAGIGAQA
jgi:DNA-binding transcriptional regulator WhiA